MKSSIGTDGAADRWALQPDAVRKMRMSPKIEAGTRERRANLISLLLKRASIYNILADIYKVAG